MYTSIPINDKSYICSTDYKYNYEFEMRLTISNWPGPIATSAWPCFHNVVCNTTITEKNTNNNKPTVNIHIQSINVEPLLKTSLHLPGYEIEDEKGSR